MKIKHLLISALLCAANLLSAQSPGRLALTAAIGNQSVGFPFQNLALGFHPALADLGLDVRLNRSARHRLSLSANAAFFANKAIGNTFLNSLNLNYRFTLKAGLFTQANIGAGGLAQFHPRTVYRYNESSGLYKKHKPGPKTSGLVGAGLSLGYDFSRNGKSRFAIYLKNQFFFQARYFNVQAFPVMPQNIIMAGVQYYIGKPQNK